MTEAKFMAIQRVLFAINNPGDIEQQVLDIINDFEKEIRAQIVSEQVIPGVVTT